MFKNIINRIEEAGNVIRSIIFEGASSTTFENIYKTVAKNKAEVYGPMYEIFARKLKWGDMSLARLVRSWDPDRTLSYIRTEHGLWYSRIRWILLDGNIADYFVLAQHGRSANLIRFIEHKREAPISGLPVNIGIGNWYGDERLTFYEATVQNLMVWKVLPADDEKSISILTQDDIIKALIQAGIFDHESEIEKLKDVVIEHFSSLKNRLSEIYPANAVAEIPNWIKILLHQILPPDKLAKLVVDYKEVPKETKEKEPETQKPATVPHIPFLKRREPGGYKKIRFAGVPKTKTKLRELNIFKPGTYFITLNKGDELYRIGVQAKRGKADLKQDIIFSLWAPIGNYGNWDVISIGGEDWTRDLKKIAGYLGNVFGSGYIKISKELEDRGAGEIGPLELEDTPEE